MEQTAIEWLIEQLDKQPEVPIYFYIFCLEALEIEKKQHGRTWNAALDACEKRGHVYVRAWEEFDEYYNQNFKKQ